MLEAKEVKAQISTLIKRYRILRGKSQRDVVKGTGLSVGAISGFENNKVALNIGIFVRLCNYLDVPAKEVLKAMTEKSNDMLLDIRKVRCCTNCANKISKNWSSGIVCKLTGESVNVDLCCRHYKETD